MNMRQVIQNISFDEFKKLAKEGITEEFIYVLDNLSQEKLNEFLTYRHRLPHRIALDIGKVATSITLSVVPIGGLVVGPVLGALHLRSLYAALSQAQSAWDSARTAFDVANSQIQAIRQTVPHYWDSPEFLRAMSDQEEALKNIHSSLPILDDARSDATKGDFAMGFAITGSVVAGLIGASLAHKTIPKIKESTKSEGSSYTYNGLKAMALHLPCDAIEYLIKNTNPMIIAKAAKNTIGIYALNYYLAKNKKINNKKHQYGIYTLQLTEEPMLSRLVSNKILKNKIPAILSFENRFWIYGVADDGKPKLTIVENPPSGVINFEIPEEANKKILDTSWYVRIHDLKAHSSAKFLDNQFAQSFTFIEQPAISVMDKPHEFLSFMKEKIKFCEYPVALDEEEKKQKQYQKSLKQYNKWCSVLDSAISVAHLRRSTILSDLLELRLKVAEKADKADSYLAHHTNFIDTSSTYHLKMVNLLGTVSGYTAYLSAENRHNRILAHLLYAVINKHNENMGDIAKARLAKLQGKIESESEYRKYTPQDFLIQTEKQFEHLTNKKLATLKLIDISLQNKNDDITILANAIIAARAKLQPGFYQSVIKSLLAKFSTDHDLKTNQHMRKIHDALTHIDLASRDDIPPSILEKIKKIVDESISKKLSNSQVFFLMFVSNKIQDFINQKSSQVILTSPSVSLQEEIEEKALPPLPLDNNEEEKQNLQANALSSSSSNIKKSAPIRFNAIDELLNEFQSVLDKEKNDEEGEMTASLLSHDYNKLNQLQEIINGIRNSLRDNPDQVLAFVKRQILAFSAESRSSSLFVDPLTSKCILLLKKIEKDKELNLSLAASSSSSISKNTS